MVDEFGQLDFGDLPPRRRPQRSISDGARSRSLELRLRLEEARVAKGVSKAELARQVEREPAAIRRLMTSTEFNPGLESLIDLADALGLDVELVRRKRVYRKKVPRAETGDLAEQS